MAGDERRCAGIRFVNHGRTAEHWQCERIITACFGFVKSGDLIEILEGRRTERPRELCGKCAELFVWDEKSRLVNNPKSFETEPLPVGAVA